MKSSLDEFVSVVDRLISRLDDLESRVAALEHHALSTYAASAKAAQAIAGPEHPLAQISRSSSAIPAVGKAFLGIAGAYVLRALAESSSIPQWAVVTVALVYAGAWLLWAARTSLEATFARAALATTAAVILSPMLWELTLRFKVMPPVVTAFVLVLFVTASAALAWKRNLGAVVWPPAACAAFTAVALLVATRDPLPFTVALLAMALLTEAAASSDRWLSLRPVMAIAADFVLLVLIGLYTGARAAPDYQPIASVVLLTLFAALFAIYTASVLARTAWQGRPISGFEIGQTVVAFVVALWGVLSATQQAAAHAVGAFCLVASALCYLLVFVRFDTAAEKRNYRVFSTWAAALLLTGTLLGFSAGPGTVWLGLAALAATFASARLGQLVLTFHGVVFLVAAAFLSGLLQHSGRLLVGELQEQASWPVWVAGVFTLSGYVLVCYPLRSLLKLPSGEDTRPESRPESRPEWRQQAIRLTFATLAVYTVIAAVITAGLLVLPAINASRLAALRTLVICLAALALGWSGSHLRRPELIWLAYAAIALCTLKLVFEDLRNGNAGTLAFSLFCYGMVWLLVPRFARASKAG